MNNKWLCGAIPALLIHLNIGSVYCWSLIKDQVASSMNVSVSSIEFAFTLAIFFLGMSAAMGGRVVEKNVKASSFISTICFSFGLILSIAMININSVIGFYLSYGVLMGIGLGIGYLSPVKTLMLWFSKTPGLATGLAIMGFGLSKTIFSPYIEWCNKSYGIEITLLSMAVISIVFMTLASILIKKPSNWVEDKNKLSFKESINIITSTNYIKVWLIFFINITCGLVIISFEKSMSLSFGIPIELIGLIAAGSAIFNALGRFGYATLSDKLDRKIKVYYIIFYSCIISVLMSIIFNNTFTWIILLMIINLGYGGGFSTLPILLKNIFGMKNISTIHGFALSAWAWAAVFAFLIIQVFIYKFNLSYGIIFSILGILYFISLVISHTIKKQTSNNI